MRAIQQSLDDLGMPLVDVEFAVLDLETTGGSPANDRITEVGVVKVRGGEVTGTFQTLVNPRIPIPPMITALTGISDGMVADQEPIEVVLPCLLEFLGDAVLVAHNASFDTRFLQAALEAHAYPRLRNRVVCTARLARIVLPRDEVPNVRLATLARYLRAGTQPCHRAFQDARATVDVLHGLLERAAGFGVLALEDLVEFPKARMQQRHSFGKVQLAADLPRSPGVYLFKDRKGQVLYVGKAKDLRARVRSYFSGDGRAKVAELLHELTAIDHVVCVNELEACVREVRLIQHHRPRYNRRGRDPERYCYLKLTKERWPRLSVVRRILADAGPAGARYLGPFGSTAQAELVKSAIEDVLPLRRCTQAIGARKRVAACVLLELRRCSGPCTGEADPEGYAAVVATLRRCFDGGDPEPLLAPLREKMRRYAAEQRYEAAASTRDRLEALSRALGDARRLAALCGAGELVLATQHRRGREVTVLRHGQLVSVGVAPAGAELTLPTGGHEPEPIAGPPPRHLVDEVRLVATWLDQAAREVELISVSGCFVSPSAGGAMLQVRYDPGRHRSLVPGEARGRPVLGPRALPRRRRAAAPVPFA